ncbi:MAG: hypothetical protein HY801_08075 [Candidatus Lindowbacteria bacterium]|nr:hypothetical protein [Candidatus Lindowbacteria bacterium]
MARGIIALMILSSLCSTAFGEWMAPPPTNEAITVPATLKSDPVQRIRLGGFVAEFEKTTLGEIRDALGCGSIEHAGDAGESQYWLCYSVPGQRVWFISHGEMGGDEHALTQVQAISTSSHSDADAACPVIPKGFQPVSFWFGWIGKDKNAVLRALGPPSGMRGETLIYFYEGKKPGVYDGEAMESDVMGYIEMEISHDKVTSIFASHVTSN